MNRSGVPRSNRFLGMMSTRDAAPEARLDRRGFAFQSAGDGLSLLSDGPILAEDGLTVSVLGAISEIDDPSFDLAEYRGRPEQLVAGLYRAHGKELAQRIDG